MRALWATVGIGALAIAGVGCGSSECADTATCAVPADGATGGDVVGPDVTVEGGGESGSGSGSGSGGDSGADADSGRPPGDSGTGSDSMVLADVVFIDSSTCATGSVCIDPVPAGWSGPLIVSDQATGPPTPTPPACPSSYQHDAFDGYLSPTSPSAVCSCACGSLSGLSCASTGIGIQVWPNGGCTGTSCGSDGLPYFAAGFCVGTGCSGGQGAIATEPLAQFGMCTPNGNSMNPASAWAETARACQPTAVGGGCSGSQVCVPSPPSAFSSKLCILQAGSVSCPAGSYSQQKVFYATTTDSRSCSPACTCTPPTNLPCTGGMVSVYDTNNGGTCGGASTNIPVDGTCHPFAIAGNVYAQATAPAVPPTGGTCTASSPQPMGGVSPAQPTTLCCQP